MKLEPQDHWCTHCRSYSKKTVEVLFDGNDTIQKKLECRYCDNISFNSYKLELENQNITRHPPEEFKVFREVKNQ